MLVLRERVANKGVDTYTRDEHEAALTLVLGMGKFLYLTLGCILSLYLSRRVLRLLNRFSPEDVISVWSFKSQNNPI